MQAYISRNYVPLDYNRWDIDLIPPVCAFCNEEVYSEYEPTEENVCYGLGSSAVTTWPLPAYFHVRDNTPICDATILGRR